VIEQELGITSELVRGSDGVFDVFADDERIFSKDDAERFPSPSEVVAALRARAQRA
jgi:selT/selW/selH-like putative selenoprotein